MRCLIVDNDIYAVRMLQAAMKPFAHCDVAFNGTEAVEMILAAMETVPFDIVFLDIMLPGHDGFSVLRMVTERAKDAGRRAPKIVLLSALEDDQTIIQAFHDGCSGYIIKPFSRAVIHAELEKLGLIESVAQAMS